MGAWFEANFQWIISLSVCLVVYLLVFAKQQGRFEEKFASLISVKDCSETRAACVLKIHERISGETDRLWTKIDEHAEDVKKAGEALARMEGRLDEAIDSMKEGIVELQKMGRIRRQ